MGEKVCILLHEAAVEPPVRLCRALASKGIRVETCTDAYAALAMLCRAEREEGASVKILLLSEPERLVGVVELVELTGVYAPNSVCWMFTSAPPEQVREVRESDLAGWRRSRLTPSPGAHDRGSVPRNGGDERNGGVKHEPILRIVNEADPTPPNRQGEKETSGEPGAGDPGRDSRRTDEQRAEEADPEPVLTDEELSMLLADEFADDSGESDPHHGQR